MVSRPHGSGDSVSVPFQGMALSPYALEGPNSPANIEVDGVVVTLAAWNDARAALESAKKDAEARGLRLVAIDFTHPTAVNANCELYSATGVPFVRYNGR